jgi:L-asparaginase / beta-aspartyl-peptidase
MNHDQHTQNGTRRAVVLANTEGGVGMAAAAAALLAGRSSLDATEVGILPVESDPRVRSVGTGGWPNLLGEIELDAAIMDGRTLKSGAVGALRGYVHPISVARQVMNQLPHVFLVGEGAARFAGEIGAEPGDNLTDDSIADWQRWLDRYVPPDIRSQWPDVPLARWARLTADPERAGGTTTFLVRDFAGDLAAGVSTCGWAQKYPGRLGDSPVVGAGTYADNRYGGAACTGHGELAIRAGTARSVVLYMKMGLSLHDAVHEAADDLRHLTREFPAALTIHAIDALGEPYVLALGKDSHTSFYWYWRDDMTAAEKRDADCETW